jgi:hypothetical protein
MLPREDRCGMEGNGDGLVTSITGSHPCARRNYR